MFITLDEEAADHQLEDKHAATQEIHKKQQHNEQDINSNSILEIKNIINSDSKPEEDEYEQKLNQEKGKNLPVQFKPSKKNKAAGNKDPLLIKENKQTKESSTQYSPRIEQIKIQTKEIGISASNSANLYNKKKSTVSVS